MHVTSDIGGGAQNVIWYRGDIVMHTYVCVMANFGDLHFRDVVHSKRVRAFHPVSDMSVGYFAPALLVFDLKCND